MKAPDHIDDARHARLVGREWHLRLNRGLLSLVGLFLLLGLANVFGQRPTTSRASSGAASLSVYAPDRVRGGLLYTVRFHVVAHRPLAHATLLLAPGWIEGMQVNSINPQPEQEGSRDGWLELDLGPIAAGKSYITFIEFQVNPTNVGHRAQDVVLADGDRTLFHLHRTITVYP
jgi:hypothetical protein